MGRGFFNISVGPYGGDDGLLILFFASEMQTHVARSQQIQLAVYNFQSVLERINSILFRGSFQRENKIAPSKWRKAGQFSLPFSFFSISIIAVICIKRKHEAKCMKQKVEKLCDTKV